MGSKPSPPLELFYCYDIQDLELLQKLDNQIKGLHNANRITTWHEDMVDPGEDEKEAIREHLAHAHIILLLVSSDFLVSCHNEWECAMERLKRKETVRVIPVLLRPADWQNTPFGHLRVLPTNKKPVTVWSNRDAAFHDIARGIGKVIEGLTPKDSEHQEEVENVSTHTDQQGEIRQGDELKPETGLSNNPIHKESQATGHGPKEQSGTKGEPQPEPKPVPEIPTHSESLVPEGLRNWLQFPWQPRRKHLKWLLSGLSACLVFLLIIAALRSPLNPLTRGSSLPVQSPTSVSTSTSVSTTKDGEQVGISDGRFAFDTNRPDGNEKSQAAAAFATGDTTEAKALWQKAAQEDPSDAEVLIYQENQHVLDSHQPHITLVVASILTGSNAHVGRDDLQGAYVAQKEFNYSPHPVQLRLLIANSGSGDESVAGDVAQQIVQAASQDKTIVGVMGWPFSESTLHAARILGPARIPLVAQTASTDLLNGTPYFFRINPPDFQQGSANTEYVTKTLHAHRVALFVDNNNAYSKSFADDFQGPFLYARNGNRIVATEQYTVGSTGQARLSSLLQDALRSNPDVIYWAGYASDLSVMLNALPPSGLGAQIPIVGGAGLYELGGYNHSAHARLKQLHFLSYAYPDEWELAGLASQKPFFFQQYSNAFNPSGKIGPGAYGSTRADNDAIVSYDATLTLFTAATSVLDSKGTKSITPEQLQQALTEIDDAHPLQGVSGRIAFGQDGNPINKPLLLLSVDPQGRFHEDALLSGCLQIDHCN